MYTEDIKSKIIDSLKKDGFKIIDKKYFLIATKKEKTLYINGLEDIRSELNFRYLAQNMQVKQVGGIDTTEIKKLVVEAPAKALLDIVSYVSNKLNWTVNFTDVSLIDEKNIYSIELITDKNETITLVFFDENRRENFIALEINQYNFFKMIDKLRYQTLESVAPELYKLISSEL